MTNAAGNAADRRLPLPELIESSGVGIIVHDRLTVLYANTAFRRMLGAVAIGERIDLPAAVAEAMCSATPENADTIITLAADGAAVREIRIMTRAVDWHGRSVLCSELVDVSSRRADSAVRLIRDAAAAIRGTTTLTGALREILAIIGERMGWTLGEIWIPDDGGTLKRCCGWRAEQHAPSAGLFPDGCGASLALTPELRSRLLERHEIVWYSGMPGLTESQMFRAELAAKAGLHSACGVPVSIDGRVAAVMMFYSADLKTSDTLLSESIAAALAPLAAHLERLRIKSELQDADERLNLVLKAAGTATWEWDLRNDTVKWDKVFNRLYGLPDELVGGTFADTIDCIHPEDRRLAAEAAEASRSACSALHVEYRIIRPDGSTRWVMARGTTLCDDDGRPLRMVGACWDQTDARSAADRLELLAKFHDENPQPVFRVLADGTVGERNSASLGLLTCWGINDDGRIPADFGAIVDEARRSGRAFVRDVAVNGAVYQANIVPVANPGYVNVYATNVTSLRRTEAALHQATKMEAVGQLAGGIAHDFNNRLTVILGNLELLESEFESASESAAILRDARLAAENSSHLARQLLAISRPQQNERAVTDVNEVIRRLDTMLDRCMGESKSMHLALDASASTVMMDAAGFEDVLVNLTINARDAMDARDTLTIETGNVWLDDLAAGPRPDLVPGEYVLVAVTDSGRGMPAEVRERAFEPFFTTKAEQGTGLGLSMVYSFVRQHAGHVSIYSEPGQGTCVKVYLPVAGQDRGETAGPGDTAGPNHVLAGIKVLVVENQADLRGIAGRIVSDLGCDVHTVEDGDHALEYLEAGGDPDLLFTDMVMPGCLDGIGLAREAKRVRPELRIVFTSGYTASGPFAEALQRSGDCNYVTKPYSRESLARALERAVTASDVTASDRAAPERRTAGRS